MDFLGIGPLELLFVLVIALIVLGPNDMVKAGRTLGRWMRRVVTSPGWQAVQQTSRDIRYLPNRLMREAGLEELRESLPDSNQIRQQSGLDQVNREVRLWKDGITDWTTPPAADQPSAQNSATDELPAGETTSPDSPVIASPPPPKKAEQEGED